jgi:hypothetical protein
MKLFEEEPSKRTIDKQSVYSLDACKIVEYELKECLTSLVQFIFGSSKTNKFYLSIFEEARGFNF